ncbi:MAG TPA: HEAT repeat domain-containing protein [Phycisphaerae bacterium]|nr:HEAT repeat domain-containing protein [Phycisphaerae bacterium]
MARWAWAGVMLAALGGCLGAEQDPRVALEAYAPARRIRAIKGIAERQEVRHIPGLVDRLDDEDVAVRLAAIVALERMTGHRFGYGAWDAPRQRTAAVNRWRAYMALEAARDWADLAAPPTAAPASE